MRAHLAGSNYFSAAARRLTWIWLHIAGILYAPPYACHRILALCAPVCLLPLHNKQGKLRERESAA